MREELIVEATIAGKKLRILGGEPYGSRPVPLWPQHDAREVEVRRGAQAKATKGFRGKRNLRSIVRHFRRFKSAISMRTSPAV